MTINEAAKIQLGAQTATAVYLGANKVWPPAVVVDPPVMTGLSIWLDASQLPLADGAIVSAWPNKGSGPATVVDAWDPYAVYRAAALGGKGTVQFSANGTRVRFTGTGINRDFTLAYVGRVWGPTSGRVISSLYPAGGNVLLGYWTTFMDIGFGGSFFLPDARQTTTNAWRLYSAWANSTTPEIHLFSNGVFIGGQAGSAYTDTFGGTFNISGYSEALDETCDCEIAELLFYDHPLTDAERIQVEGYLRTKWGLP